MLNLCGNGFPRCCGTALLNTFGAPSGLWKQAGRILFGLIFFLVPSTALSDEFLARAALLNNDFDFAREIYSDLYEEGNPEAAFVLGLMYREGWGRAEDPGLAREFLTEARMRGHVEASYWLCRDSYEAAAAPAEFDTVADLCMPASALARSKTTKGFIYHPHHVALAKHVAGKALLRAGSEKTAFLCLISAYIFADGEDALREEVRDIESTLARYSPKWFVGSWQQERPYDERYGPTDKIPPCMISPIAATKVHLGGNSPMMKGILSSLGLR